MKRPLVVAMTLAAVFLVVLFGVFGSVRVPGDHQGVRLGKGGDATHYGPGFHLVRPFSGPLVIYPAGAVERRFPSDGVYEALTSAGEGASIALQLSIEIKENAGEFIHRAFGRDLWSGLSDLVRETVEIEMAQRPSEGTDPDELAGGIVDAMRTALGKAGIRVVGVRVDTFEVTPGLAVGVTPPAAASKPIRKVIFIGVDGGDWELINPMMEKGHLPHFKKIVEEGTTGRLRSIEPLLSPLIWTTIATGKLPEDHGVLSFTMMDPQKGRNLPITRASRKVDALWNILTEHGRTVDIVGWLASFPAEDINGVMVTDRAGYLAYAPTAGDETLAPGIVSPAERVDEISRLVFRSRDLEYGEFRRMLDLDRGAFEEYKAMPFDSGNPVTKLIMLYATAKTFHRIAKELVNEDRPDFLGVYFEWCDAVGHLFIIYAPPRLPWIDENDYEKYKDVMFNTYVVQDRMIGEFIEMCDDETVIIMASDHGFKNGPNRLRLENAALWHQLYGIVGFYGNGVRRGHRLEGATVVDLAPTFLALQGLPRAADMPGKVLVDAFEDSLADRLDKTVVATLESRRRKQPVSASSGAADEEVLKKLEALGYLTASNPNDYNNLGQRYQQQGDHEKAIEQFKKALAINPGFPGALNNIGVSYGKLGQYALAEEAFKKAISLNKRDVHAMNNLAIMYMETGDFDSAVEYGEMVIQTEPKYANGHLTLGSVYATIGNRGRAEQEFMKALELDPDNEKARQNLRKLRSEEPRSGARGHGGEG